MAAALEISTTSEETIDVSDIDGPDTTMALAEGKEVMLAKGEIHLDGEEGEEKKGNAMQKYGLTGRVYANGWLQNAWRNNFVRRLTRVVGLKFVRCASFLSFSL